jgi:hypothetical protein
MFDPQTLQNKREELSEDFRKLGLRLAGELGRQSILDSEVNEAHLTRLGWRFAEFANTLKKRTVLSGSGSSRNDEGDGHDSGNKNTNNNEVRELVVECQKQSDFARCYFNPSSFAGLTFAIRSISATEMP